MLSDPSFESVFIFSINSLILFGFPLTSFNLAEASLSAFSWLYTLVCALVQNITNIIFSTRFAIKLLATFAQLGNVNKLWNNNHNVHVNEQNQIDHVFHLAYKQWNGIIKGCLHCLMSNSKGRFLVNNMLMFTSS